VGSQRLASCKVFDVDEVRFVPPDGDQDVPFYRIVTPDWINVIPLADDGHVLFVRQYRFGTENFTLEIPGGMCDPGEQPLESARRELREETGYEAASWKSLGAVHPNPALQSNRCHTFLARELTRVGAPQPDEHESFEAQQLSLDQVRAAIASGEITHSLVVAAFHLLDVSGELS